MWGCVGVLDEEELLIEGWFGGVIVVEISGSMRKVEVTFSPYNQL